eukprot:508466-Amphidinium_carterae.1
MCGLVDSRFPTPCKVSGTAQPLSASLSQAFNAENALLWLLFANEIGHDRLRPHGLRNTAAVCKVSLHRGLMRVIQNGKWAQIVATWNKPFAASWIAARTKTTST